MGKFKTYIFVGACGLLVGGAMVFLPFPGASQVVKAILFVVGYIIWDAAYTMANVPYGTMLNIVTTDDQERASLSVFRSIGGAVGGMLPGIILPMLIWNKVTFDPQNPTWFLDKIEIPEGAEGAFVLENFLTNPKTGDEIFVPVAVMGLSVSALAVLFYLNKKRAF